MRKSRLVICLDDMQKLTASILLQSNFNFAQSMKDILNLPVCDRLTYVDFLAKPLQRLTKYPLLLKVVTSVDIHGCHAHLMDRVF